MRPSLLKRDLWQVGLLIGLILPTVSSLLLYTMDFVFFEITGFHITKQSHYLLLLCVIPNLFPMRYYMIKLRFEKTGLGILLITIVAIITYFYIFYQPR